MKKFRKNKKMLGSTLLWKYLIIDRNDRFPSAKHKSGYLSLPRDLRMPNAHQILNRCGGYFQLKEN
jgi:hypothetical protein